MLIPAPQGQFLSRQREFHQLRRFRLADERLFPVQFRKLHHFPGSQRKIEQGQIFPDVRRLGASGDDGNALLGQEAEQDLRRSFAVLRSKGQHGRFLIHFIPAALFQGGIGRHVGHLLLVHPDPLSAALAIEIGFDLIDSRDDLVVGNQVQKLVRLKVGNADGLDFAVCI